MGLILDSFGEPILDSNGLDDALLDAAGQVILDSSGHVIAFGTGGGQPLLDSYGDPAPPSTTDAAGMAARLRVVLPERWFADEAPVLDVVLQGLGAGWTSIYEQIGFAGLQTRIATATGAFLDMCSLDYLGGRLVRKPGQGDAAFSAAIRREIIRPRATRAALVQVLTDLTGRAPRIFEPAQPNDTGGYGALGMTAGTGLGYGVAGGWGSLALPGQVFVNAYRATSGGIPGVGGYYTGSGWAGGGYGVGALQWASLSMSLGQITDADIYAAAASVMPAAGIAWTRVQN